VDIYLPDLAILAKSRRLRVASFRVRGTLAVCIEGMWRQTGPLRVDKTELLFRERFAGC